MKHIGSTKRVDQNYMRKKMLIYNLFYRNVWLTDYKQAGDSVNYAFEENNKTLYIQFEGSNSITDWVRNFWFFKKPYKDMEIPYKVHGGFLAAWKEVEDIIINKITEKDEKGLYKYNKIITLGYSHGGALSGLCHECVWFHRPDIRENIFGIGVESPRFYHGWRVKKSLRERWENYVVIRNCNDIVTHAPPAILKYCHVGKIIKVGDKSKLKRPKCIKAHYPVPTYEGIREYEKNNKIGL